MAFSNRLWTTLFRSNRQERRIAEELAFHIDQRAAENRAAGMNPTEALEDARRRFGPQARLYEETRDAGVLEWVDSWLRDVRLACRTLSRRSGLTATIVASLAIGIGAGSAIFSAVDGVLLRPLQIVEPERVFAIEEYRHGAAHNGNPMRLADWTKQASSFASVMGFYGEGLTMTGQGAPERVRTWRTLGDPLAILGVQPTLGRGFTDRELNGVEPVALLDHGFWSSRFNADPRVLGQSVTLGGRGYTVVGVLPAGVDYPGDIDAVIPASLEVHGYTRRASFLGEVARLKPGAGPQAAQAELNTIAARLAKQFPATDANLEARLTPLRETVTREARKPLLILLATVGFVLLIACVNTASLLLSRASERGRESAIRLALGAGRASLVRLYLVESLVLAVVGGLLGIALAELSLDTLVRLLPPDLPRLTEIHLDLRVGAISLAASLVCGLLFGLAPALQAARFGAQKTSIHRLRSRRVLVVCQIALSAILLVGVGLLAKSLFLLLRTPLGFGTTQVTTVQVNLPWDTDAAALAAFYTRTLETLSNVPGVRAAGVIDRLPLHGGAQSGRITVRGVTLSPDLQARSVSYRGATPGYFGVLGIPLLAGRLMRDPHEIVVNQEMARQFFADGRAVGSSLSFSGAKGDYQIVGVVGNVRQEPAQTAAVPEAFLAMNEVYWPMANFVLRTEGNVNSAVRTAMMRVNPDQVFRISSLDRELQATVREPEVRLWLVGAFAFTALLLAAIGVYGLLASDVVLRTREIGIRMAIGADPRSILRETAWRAFTLVAAGLAIGGTGAAGLTRYLRSLLYVITPNDATAYLGAALTLLAVAFAAAYLPARRAAGIAPGSALRHE
jgi:putative ABC transport system permease protein